MNKPQTRRAQKVRKEDVDNDDRRAALAQAADERKAKSQLVLFGSIGGGVLFLLLVIAVASSSGGSSSSSTRKKAVAAAPVYEPPPEPKKVYNYVRNTGAIVFVCGGTEKHPDKEVVVANCAGCKAKNAFTVDGEAQGYRCSKCKAVQENAALKCDVCERVPRVTHLKKALGGG